MNGEQVYVITVPAEDEGKRLDILLGEHLTEYTRSFLQNRMTEGAVTVDGKAAKKNYKVRAGEQIKLTVGPPVDSTAAAEDISLNIVYEDDDLLVINKAKGMVVHPAPGNYTGTLVNALLHHCGENLSGIGGVVRPGIVHRIDKDTSGLIIAAKNDKAHRFLAGQISEHTFTREYQTVVYGHLKEPAGTIRQPIGRSEKDRKKMAINPKGKMAVTHYETIEEYDGFSHIRCRLETGRTHQIRVHLAYLGHPVAGDPLYGPKKILTNLQGQCLHAKKIGFIHPRTREYIEFDSELPAYFKKFLSGLTKQ